MYKRIVILEGRRMGGKNQKVIVSSLTALLFVWAIRTVGIAVTHPCQRNALAFGFTASELIRVAYSFFWNHNTTRRSYRFMQIMMLNDGRQWWFNNYYIIWYYFQMIYIHLQYTVCHACVCVWVCVLLCYFDLVLCTKVFLWIFIIYY
jgi:hypothetical protein